jgi:cell division protein FtsI/penicillin-binding protein 2
MALSEKEKAYQKRYRESGKKNTARKRAVEKHGEEGAKQRREYALTYYYANHEKCKEQSRVRKAKQASLQTEDDKIRARETFLLRKFGILIADYDALLVSQNGVCAICRKTCPSGRRLAVDHCHDTGKVRGLLCTPCNTAIGLVKEDTLRLRALIDYIERHKCL